MATDAQQQRGNIALAFRVRRLSRRLRLRTIIVLLAGACAVVLLAPNVLWLVRSTARVDNHTNLTLESLQVQVDSAVTSADDLPGGSSRFLVCPTRETLLSRSGFELVH